MSPALGASVKAIPLDGGPPGGKTPASFSRFLLPFAYQAGPFGQGRGRQGPEASPYYRRLGSREFQGLEAEIFAGRLRYLTTETSITLFRRASWWRLVPGRGDDSPTGSGPEGALVWRMKGRWGQPFQVALAPPTLILFEWEGREAAQRAATRATDLMATGFLLLELFFPDGEQAPDLDDLLELNELFRYWRSPFPGHAPGKGGKGYQEVLAEVPARPFQEDTPLGDLPRTGDGTPEQLEALYTGRWLSLLDLPLESGGRRLRLFPWEWERVAKRWRDNPAESVWKADAGARLGNWACYADSRAFVWTCAVVQPGSRPRFEKDGALDQHPAWSGRWIKLLNVDRPGGDPTFCSPFEREWADSRTYRRWEHFGSLYGFTYHSGALLGEWCAEPPTWQHFRGMYFDQVLFLLYLRVTSFRFSQALAESAAQARDAGGAAEWNGGSWRERFQALRREFVLFTDLYQYPLVSNQQQGLEMYALAREVLDVNVLFNEIEREIQTTDEYFTAEAGERLARAEHRLSRLGAWGLPLAIVASLLGMDLVLPDRASLTLSGELMIAALVVALVSLYFLLVPKPPRWLRRLGDLLQWNLTSRRKR